MNAMTRSQTGAERRRTRRRHGFGSLAAVVALLSTLLITGAAPAHALVPCADINFCPVSNEDTYNVNFGLKLTVDAAHGLLVNDEGPAITKVNTAPGLTDTESWNGAKVSVKSDGSFTYTPDLSDPLTLFSGQDSFDYTIGTPADPEYDFNTVWINVIPVVRNDFYGTKTRTLDSDLPLIVGDPGVLANDGGIDPDSVVFPTVSQHGGTIDDAGQGAFVYTAPLGFKGVDTFQYTGTDLDFDPDLYPGTVTIYVDGTAPTATMLAPGLVNFSTKVNPVWTGSDDPGGTGIASYDVQYNIAVWNAPFQGYKAWKTAVPASTTTAQLAGTYGRTFCFRT